MLLRYKNNKDIKNIMYVVLQNITNYLLPFITFSYIIKTIGFEKFGLIGFVNSIFLYLTVIAEYGFIISATREISYNIDNRSAINKTVSNVLVVKLILFLAAAAVFFSSYPFNAHLQENLLLYLITMVFAFGQSFIPNWFFQGIQDLRSITLISIIVKIVQFIMIFIFVKSENDFILYQIINSGFIIILIATLYFIIYYKYQFRPVKVSFSDIKSTLKEGWHLFVSNISVSLYTNSITVLLGYFYGNLYVGYYSAAEKLIIALKSLTSPISQVMYPKLIIMSKESKQSVLNFNRKMLFLGSIPFILIAFIILIFSKDILYLIINQHSENTDTIFRILSFIPLIAFWHSIFALCTLLVFGESKIYSNIVILGGVLNVFVGTALIYFFKDIGAAISVVFIELFVLVSYIWATKKKGLSVLKI